MTREQIIETMCDDYCKKPLEYLTKYKDPDAAQDNMWNEACIKCPLFKLQEVTNEESIQDRRV
jgi:hypothetical protein